MEVFILNKPYISKELSEYLDKLYPVTSPKLTESLQEIYFNAGRADVARHIKELYEKQQQIQESNNVCTKS